MKSSQYNVFIIHKNQNYIYNTLTTALVKVSSEIRHKLETHILDTIDTNLLGNLKQNGIIVDRNLDELAVFRYYYNSMQYSENHDELKIVFVPTYKCNLKCFYCFEECNHIQHQFADENVVEQIFSFVQDQLNTHPTYKRVSLILFGGEPLICKKQCADICQKLSVVLKKNQIAFNPKIITNATLLDEIVIKELIVPYNMHIQITLDGVEDIHDQRKMYKNGKGTYKQITSAIDLLYKLGCKDLVDLRINIDKTNLHCVSFLLQEFHEKVGFIYLGLLRPYGNNSCHSESCISQNEFQITYKTQLFPILKKFHIENTSLGIVKQHPCGMNRLNTFIIDYLLDVYKCENLLGNKKYAVGHIVNGKMQKEPAYYNQVAWTPFNAKCNDCILLPACAGSCPYLCLMENGNINQPLCSITHEQLIKKICLYIDELNE